MLSKEEFSALVAELKLIPNNTTGIRVQVIDTETGLGKTYRSKKHASREMNVGEDNFYPNRKSLVENRYQIIYLSKRAKIV
jgi:hypothetical protein